MYRTENIHFAHSPDDGRIILPNGEVLMEIKTPFGVPLWLARLLCETSVYSTSFSKYGRCFADMRQREALEREEVKLSA